MLEATARLGPYEIVAPLGAGGMGVVYRARDTRLEREVAIKVLPDAFTQDPDRRARFEREAKAVAALSHPNILAIHDFGTHNSIPYAVMELLEGSTFRTRLVQGPIPWREAVLTAAAIAGGLTAAHAKGIIHRDLKPENLFLTDDGRVKILDFGLARMTVPSNPESDTSPFIPGQTETGTIIGTVGYMSPEQVRGQTVDARSDIFSFGCILYEMVSNRRAFQRETAADTMTAILRDEPAAFGKPVVAPLECFIRQCLCKNPAQRVQTALELVRRLRELAIEPNEQIYASPVAPLAAKKKDDKAVEAVAVLPFENVGGDPKLEYLSDGLSDHVIISLSQLRRRDLKVRPFTSVLRYKKQPIDIPTIARELKVQVVATGTLHQQGDDLWVSVSLVDAREDDHLWGKRYHGKLSEILDLQDQIARDVATNLRLQLTSEEDQLLTKRHTEDPEAYLLFREAIHHWNKFTLDGLNTAIEYCKRALVRDSNYGLAYVGLAQCYVLLGNLYLGPRATFTEARRCAERALEIDGNLQLAHTFLGAVFLFHDWNWTTAERELKQSSATNTSFLTLYGFWLAAMGRPQEALDTLRRGQELDPLRAPHRHEVGMAYNWLRRHDLAIVEAEKALELDPTFPLAYAELGIAYVQQGRMDEAIARLSQAVELGQRHPLVVGLLGYAFGAAGKRAEALKVLGELVAAAPGQFGFSFPIARIFAGLGEKDQAFDWLKKAGDERTPHIIWIKVDPTLDNLRSDSRFRQMLQGMNLPV